MGTQAAVLSMPNRHRTMENHVSFGVIVASRGFFNPELCIRSRRETGSPSSGNYLGREAQSSAVCSPRPGQLHQCCGHGQRSHLGWGNIDDVILFKSCIADAKSWLPVARRPISVQDAGVV